MLCKKHGPISWEKIQTLSLTADGGHSKTQVRVNRGTGNLIRPLFCRKHHSKRLTSWRNNLSQGVPCPYQFSQKQTTNYSDRWFESWLLSHSYTDFFLCGYEQKHYLALWGLKYRMCRHWQRVLSRVCCCCCCWPKSNILVQSLHSAWLWSFSK